MIRGWGRLHRIPTSDANGAGGCCGRLGDDVEGQSRYKKLKMTR
jgi:hypothetical protein